MTIRQQGGVFGRHPSFSSITSDQIDIIGSGSFGGNVSVNGNVLLASGSGVDFSATSGTGTSELFDDYEEGTWTPTLEGSISAGDYLIAPVQCVYTKIGNVVHVSGQMTITVNSAGTGLAKFGGLPFASENQPVYYGNVRSSGLSYGASTLFAVTTIWASNSSDFSISQNRDGTTPATLAISGITTGNVINVTMAYRAQ